MASKTQLPSTEQPDPRFHDLDAWPVAGVLQAMWEGQLAAVAAVGPALPLIAAAAEACVERLGRGGRLVYAGAGTSGRRGTASDVQLAGGSAGAVDGRW